MSPLTCDEGTGRCLMSCAPKCLGRECGPDGCGGLCGQCPSPQTCDDGSGQCTPPCTPDCTGKQCGPDGCGSLCGTCTFPQICDASSGQCMAGGDCGTITYEGCCTGQTLKYCQNGKLLKQDCTQDPKCGWDSKNSYYNCGTMGGADPSGQFPKKCP